MAFSPYEEYLEGYSPCNFPIHNNSMGWGRDFRTIFTSKKLFRHTKLVISRAL
jgi:hypothetical protein